MFGRSGIPNNPYLSEPLFKHIVQKHIRFCDLRTGLTCFLEQKDGEIVKKVAIMSKRHDGITVKVEDGTEETLSRSDFGFTWRCWWYRPTAKERVMDSWR